MAGWLASEVGLVGIFECNAVTPLPRVPRSNVLSRAGTLMAIRDAGPHASLRTGCTGPRDRVLSVGDTLRDVGWAVLVLACTGSIADRLGAINARMQ